MDIYGGVVCVIVVVVVVSIVFFAGVGVIVGLRVVV